MLLRHTTAEEFERSALTINPAKTCQPIGAMYAALGIHGCLPHSHGSQGCCAYHRSALTKHYKEPAMAATSSFTEGSAVFGGQANLLQALNTIHTLYNPEIIAVHTTCLSETIGDDVPQIINKAISEKQIPADLPVIYANTPSYQGSHVNGFSTMVLGMVRGLAQPSEIRKARRVNVIPGWVEPADMHELKRILGVMGLDYILFPDTDGVLNCGQTGEYKMYPDGGVTIDQLRSVGASSRTFALGSTTSAAGAKLLDQKCKVPCDILEMPIGLRATDAFLYALRKRTGVPIPAELINERARLLDLMIDMGQYFKDKRVALWGDPDQLVSLSEFLVDLGMKPVYVVTGTPDQMFEKKMDMALQGKVPEARIKSGMRADMYLMHQWIKQEPVDLLIGNTYGKYISRDENIPFVRHGFPILDRITHQFFPTVGYQGAIHLLDQILMALMNKQDADAPECKFELTM